ncbi:MAG: hypothetical protein Q4A34_01185 [Candidatus Saccharibacteria bacterium]|nr:hypothetical protein [Candidatus Saccharibacteria bacterium]
MADTRKTRAKIRRLQRLKTWQLVVLFMMTGFMSATFLRLNNVGMVERRQAVYSADEEGSSTLQSRLYDLQRYVASHMNADPGKIALDKSYQRDNQKQKEAYASRVATTPHADAYAKAEAVCGPKARAQGWRWPDMRYTQCLKEELEKIPGGEAVTKEFQPIPPEPYYHTFVSPAWSPDFAGWSLVITGVIGLSIAWRSVVIVILRMILRRQRTL